jgi:hypothetical protein
MVTPRYRLEPAAGGCRGQLQDIVEPWSGRRSPVIHHAVYHMIHHMTIDITMCTMQIELMDSDMVEYAIDMVHELDRTYGFPPKRTMSQVP